MAMNNGLRSCASKFLTSAESFLPNSVNRGFHSTGVKRMSGGHGHDEPFYLHAKHMYNLDRMTHQKLKMSLAVFTAFSIGVGVPIYAVMFQQKKTASGVECSSHVNILLRFFGVDHVGRSMAVLVMF